MQATEMVQNASPEDLEETIAQANQKIKDAQQQEQGFVKRMYTKAKRFVTAPVDYVFGEEASYAKTAFYAAVGLAVLAVGTYGAYKYFDLAKVSEQDIHPNLELGNNDLVSVLTGRYAHKELLKKIDKKYPNMPQEFKKLCIDYIDNKRAWHKAEQASIYGSRSKFIDKDIAIANRLKESYPDANITNLTYYLTDLYKNVLFAEKYGNFSYNEVLKELEQLAEEYQKNPYGPNSEGIKKKMSAFRYELWLRRGRRGGI